MLSDCLIMDTYKRNAELQHKLNGKERVKFHPGKSQRNKVKRAVDEMFYFQSALVC